MGNDLKYGLILGVVVLLIFVGYMTMRNNSDRAAQPADPPAQVAAPAAPFDMFAAPGANPPSAASQGATAPPAGQPPVAIYELGRPAADSTTAVRDSSRDLFEPPSTTAGTRTASARDAVVVPAAGNRTIPLIEPDLVSLDRSESAGPNYTSAPQPRTHTVASGETLQAISQKYFGTTTRWPAIRDANPGIDPNRLSVGARLVIPEFEGVSSTAPVAQVPPTTGSAPAATAPARTHTVVAGDTLYALSAKYYGDGNHWRKIYDANRDKMSSPEAVRVGVKLNIP